MARRAYLRIQANANGRIENDVDDVIVQSFLQLNSAMDWKTGTGADQVDRLWKDVGRSLTVATGDITLDLSSTPDVGSGAGNDSLGQSLDMVTATALIIKNNAGGSLLVGPNTATTDDFPAFADQVTIPPGGMLLITAPDASGFDISTNHEIGLAASGSDVTDYDIFVAGRSS